MTFSYSGDPESSDLDTVRFLIQDTLSDEPLLSDEEINFMLKTWKDRGSLYYVAARCCETIAAQFAREVSISSDSQSISLSELMQKYTTLAEQLRSTDNSLGVGELFVGGDALSGSQGPIFGIGMHDDPGNGLQDIWNQRVIDPMQWGTNIP